MQMRRLDPLAKAGPYQRIVASPAKSFTLSEVQFDRLRQTRPDLVLIDGDSAIVGRLNRDYLEIHYAFPDVETFRDRFTEMFKTVVAGTNKQEAPRGLVLSFRDRPNRMVADTVFWSLALDQGQQWVEFNYVLVPEQPEAADDLGDGFVIRDLADAEFATLGALDGAVTSRPPLTPAAIAGLVTDAKALRVIVGPLGGAAAGYVSLRGEPGGWGVIDIMALAPKAEALRASVLRWCVAWLRNNGSRRVRHRVLVDDSSMIGVLRDAGFTPGETGLDYTRSVDAAEVRRKIEERQAHGSVIKFGDWR